MADGPQQDPWKTFTEEIEIAGHQLVDTVTKLIAEGNIRRIKVRSQKGDVFLDIPLSFGAVTGGVVALAAPWLAVLGAVAGLLTRVKIEVVRQEPRSDETADKATSQEPKVDPMSQQNPPDHMAD
jgi:hypothetical protein